MRYIVRRMDIPVRLFQIQTVHLPQQTHRHFDPPTRSLLAFVIFAHRSIFKTTENSGFAPGFSGFWQIVVMRTHCWLLSIYKRILSHRQKEKANLNLLEAYPIAYS